MAGKTRTAKFNSIEIGVLCRIVLIEARVLRYFIFYYFPPITF